MARAEEERRVGGEGGAGRDDGTSRLEGAGRPHQPRQHLLRQLFSPNLVPQCLAEVSMIRIFLLLEVRLVFFDISFIFRKRDIVEGLKNISSVISKNYH